MPFRGISSAEPPLGKECAWRIPGVSCYVKSESDAQNERARYHDGFVKLMLPADQSVSAAQHDSARFIEC